MANSGGDRRAYDEMYDKILDLREQMETIRESIEQLDMSLREGTEDDLEDIAMEEYTKLDDFHRRFRLFERDCVDLVLNPSESESYHKRFQEFAQELNNIDQGVHEYFLLLETTIQEPAEAIKEAEEQDRLLDLLVAKELEASSDGAGHTLFGNLEGKILLQSEMQAMERFFEKKLRENPPSPPKHPTPKLSPEAAAGAADASVEGKKKMEVFNMLPSTNWNLSDVIMHVYGFARTESQQIEMQIDKPLTENPYRDIGSSKVERILDWGAVSKAKEKLQEYKTRIQKAQNLIPGLLKIWISRMENRMYNLVVYLRFIMSGYEPAMARFEELRTSLGEYRQRNDGRVPIVAHTILKLLEMQEPEEQSELNRDQQEALYRDSNFDQVFGSIQKMVSLCKALLVVSDGVGNTARRMSPNEMERCEQVLEEAEEELNGIERRILEGRKNVQNKSKREDEDGGNGSGSGSSEM